jgi:hypothetical protein
MMTESIPHQPHLGPFHVGWLGKNVGLKFVGKDRLPWLNANSNRCFEHEKPAQKVQNIREQIRAFLPEFSRKENDETRDGKAPYIFRG